jgi:hypothetical protein
VTWFALDPSCESELPLPPTGTEPELVCHYTNQGGLLGVDGWGEVSHWPRFANPCSSRQRRRLEQPGLEDRIEAAEVFLSALRGGDDVVGDFLTSLIKVPRCLRIAVL